MNERKFNTGKTLSQSEVFPQLTPHKLVMQGKQQGKTAAHIDALVKRLKEVEADNRRLERELRNIKSHLDMMLTQFKEVVDFVKST